MNPQDQFCPNLDCPDKGKSGEGNIVSHSRKEQRCKCKTCGQTFAVTRGTPFFGLKHKHELFVLVVTLLTFGCPVQAIVMAFGLDERTVRAWLLKSGAQAQQVHEDIIGKAQLDLQQVQADEIKVRGQRGSFWMAFAMMVPTRLWLGGAVSPQRDKALIRSVVDRVRSIALCRPLLFAVDGLSSYVGAIRRAFRSPLHTGQLGRPRLIPWQDVAIVQVVKRRTQGSLHITRRIVQGTQILVDALLQATQGTDAKINTAYIERLNGTFRQRLGCLARRSRQAALQAATLTAGMWLVGTIYNFCTPHKSLRQVLWLTERKRRWVSRTPAMAAGLSDQCWSISDLLWYKVRPTLYVPPKRRGRLPKIRPEAI